MVQFRQTRWELHQMCHIGSCFATNWMINRAAQTASRPFGCGARLTGEWLASRGRGSRWDGDTELDHSDWLCLLRSEQRFPFLVVPQCSRAIPHTNTGGAREREEKKKKEGGCCVPRRIAEACSSWQVISAFSSTLLTLIMQLNAALRIPAAAHPHYNTLLPLSPTLSATHSHTHKPQSVSLPPPSWPQSQASTVKDSIFLFFLRATPLQRHDHGNAFFFSFQENLQG